jgi:ArsR family transcriptional regulator
MNSVMARFFLALGDETRLRVLEALREKGALNVGELCEALEKEQSHVSHHLACLRNCGIVKAEKRGKYVYYSINGSHRILRIMEQAEEHVREAFEEIAMCEVVE